MGNVISAFVFVTIAIGSLLALDGKWTRPAGRSWIYYVKRVIDAPPDALLGQLLSDKPSPDDAIHWLNGELDRVFPTAESMIEEMKLEDRFKDVTFETLDRDDFLASVEAAFPNLDWVKPYEAFKAAGEKINQKRVKGG